VRHNGPVENKRLDWESQTRRLSPALRAKAGETAGSTGPASALCMAGNVETSANMAYWPRVRAHPRNP
jgi:hypothetical protein